MSEGFNFNAEEYFGCLEVLPYEKIIELLGNEEKTTYINISSFIDMEGNGKKYFSIEVRTSGEEKPTNYLAPDQNAEDIENNLSNAIMQSSLNYQFMYCDDQWKLSYYCEVGQNRVSFPRETAQKIVRQFRELRINSKEYQEQEKVRAREMFPETKNDELPFKVSDY